MKDRTSTPFTICYFVVQEHLPEHSIIKKFLGRFGILSSTCFYARAYDMGGFYWYRHGPLLYHDTILRYHLLFCLHGTSIPGSGVWGTGTD